MARALLYWFMEQHFFIGGENMKSLVLIATLLLSAGANAQSFGGGNDSIGLTGGMYSVERQIECSSHSNQYAQCDTRLERTQRVYLARQLSKSACIEGQSYRARGSRIEVWSGCRAVFIARGLTQYPSGNDAIISKPDEDYGNVATVTVLCESHDHKINTCSVPLSKVRSVQVYQQHSKAACIEGHSYRVLDRRYIQVSNGCRATFVATGRR